MGRVVSLAASRYSQVGAYTGVEVASSHHLVEMLFGGLLQKLSTAKGAIGAGHIRKKGEAIGKAINILDGLRAALNLEVGGKVASNLDSLYDYMQHRLLQANLEGDSAILDELTSLILEIKEAWMAIADQSSSPED